MIVPVSSHNSSSPTTVYTGVNTLLILVNPDPLITVHVRDPQVNGGGNWIDLPPGYSHPLVRHGAGVKSAVVAYADSGTPNLIINEARN